jgi:exodeoxyribonuclease V alpha subunit
VVEDLVLLDECSMVDMSAIEYILFSVLSSPNPKTRLLIMGDNFQLPCIGRGKPMKNLSDLLPLFTLTRCMRSERAGILSVCKAIRDSSPVDKDMKGEGIVFVPLSEEKDILRACLSLLPSKSPPPWDKSFVQIVTWTNECVRKINSACQSKYSSGGDAFFDCKQGDPIVFTSNEEEYKNGEVALLVSVFKDEKGELVASCKKENGSFVDIKKKHIEPCYCITVHKSQGSEFSTTVLAIFNKGSFLPDSELIYTACSRARNSLVVVGAVELINSCTPSKRKTIL